MYNIPVVSFILHRIIVTNIKYTKHKNKQHIEEKHNQTTETTVSCIIWYDKIREEKDKRKKKLCWRLNDYYFKLHFPFWGYQTPMDWVFHVYDIIFRLFLFKSQQFQNKKNVFFSLVNYYMVRFFPFRNTRWSFII